MTRPCDLTKHESKSSTLSFSHKGKKPLRILPYGCSNFIRRVGKNNRKKGEYKISLFSFCNSNLNPDKRMQDKTGDCRERRGH
jgi:hypothetical protein